MCIPVRDPESLRQSEFHAWQHQAYLWSHHYPKLVVDNRNHHKRKSLPITTRHILDSSYLYTLRFFFNNSNGLFGCLREIQRGDVVVADRKMPLPLPNDRGPTF